MSDVIYLDTKEYSVLLSTIALCRELRYLSVKVSAGLFKNGISDIRFDTNVNNITFKTVSNLSSYITKSNLLGATAVGMDDISHIKISDELAEFLELPPEKKPMSDVYIMVRQADADLYDIDIVSEKIMAINDYIGAFNNLRCNGTLDLSGIRVEFERISGMFVLTIADKIIVPQAFSGRKNMKAMFESSKEIRQIIVDTSEAEILDRAFYTCTHLESADIDLSNAKSVCDMLAMCSNLKEVTLRNAKKDIRMERIVNGSLNIDTMKFINCDFTDYAEPFKQAFIKALEAAKNLAKFYSTELKNVPFRVQMPFNRSFFDIANSVKIFECEGCNKETTELVEHLNSLSRLIHFEGMKLDYLE